MLDYLEESLNSKTFFRNAISEKVIDNARSILSRASTINEGLCGEDELRKMFESIDCTDSGKDEDVATLVVAACIRLCGKTWEIHNKNYIWDIVPRVPQIAAALKLCDQSCGQFALQRTGEGKTVTVLVTIALCAKHGQVHVVTANEYLAFRDYQWIGPVLELLGITCSFLTRDNSHKKDCYTAQVLFGADKEFVFDYLRDSVRQPDEPPLCQQREFVVVDEGDHILLDELMTPAIISKECRDKNTFLVEADEIIRVLLQLQERYCTDLLSKLKGIDENSVECLTSITELRHCGKKTSEISEYFEKKQELVIASQRYEFKRFMQGSDSGWYTNNLYFDVNLEERNCTFTDRGMEYIEKVFGYVVFTVSKDTSDASYNFSQYQLLSSLLNALEVHVLLRRDVDYIVRNSKIEVITSSIGRADSQKRFGHGLAGAVAVKENVEYTNDSLNVTRTTIVSFVKEYNHCAVLSGTLLPDHVEFEKLYAAKTFPVPTYKPIIAKYTTGYIYNNSRLKYEGLVAEVLYYHEMGRPVLVGTNSIVISETIACMLEKNSIAVRIMNAKNEDEEARIISQAGEFGAITIATNMAGRGCDISVAEETEGRICDTFLKKISELTMVHSAIDVECSSHYEADSLQNSLSYAGAKNVQFLEKGPICLIRIDGTGVNGKKRLTFGLGLHVVIAECCTSRRIETQLRGRTGRQGNPGSSSLFVSLDDEALLPVSSLRWLGYWINRWFGFTSNLLIRRILLLMIYGATENDLRFKRSERLFYDSISELIRKRFVAMRERALTSPNHRIVRDCIRSYLDYLNEEATLFKSYEARINLITSRLQEVLCIDNLKFPKVILNEFGCIDSGIEKWVAGLLVIKKIQLSSKSILFLYCSCIDEIWSNFSAALESHQEQAYFWAFAGRDPKVSYVEIIFSKWHESAYYLFESFLRKVFLQHSHSTEKLKITTNSSNDELEKLFAL